MTGKVVIVGDGNVGSALAYGLYSQGICRSLSLIDINGNKVQGDVLDMLHGQIYSEGCEVEAGTYYDMRDCDVVVLTASVSGKKITDRNQLLAGNLKLYHDILPLMESKLNPRAKIIVVANPCDSLALFVKTYLKLPSSQVMASGCTLDSARLCYRLGKYFKVPAKDVKAYVIGEHGNSQVSVLSSATIENININKFKEAKDIDPEKWTADVAKEGFVVSNLKGCTDYGVALATCEIIRSILEDRGELLPVSVSYPIEGKEIYLSLPAIVGKEGIRKVLPVFLNNWEKKKFDESVKVLLEKRVDVMIALKEFGRLD